MPILTHKIRLYIDYSDLTKEEYGRQKYYLYAINSNLYKVANKISSELYLQEEMRNILKHNDREYCDMTSRLKKKNITPEERKELEQMQALAEKRLRTTEREIFNRPPRSAAYTIASEFAGGEINAAILVALKDNVFKKFEEQKRAVVLGERSVSSYRQGMPIPFPINEKYHVYKEGETYYLKWVEGIRFKMDFGRDRGRNRIVVDRALGISADGIRYKFCNSSISFKKVNGKEEIFLLLCIDIPAAKHELDTQKVVGIDIGVNVPLYAALNFSPRRLAVGSREAFVEQRNTFQKRFFRLQKLECTHGGRGFKKKMETLDRLRTAEKKWARNLNHMYSRAIVDFALKNGAGVIQMENLKGYGVDGEGNKIESKRFLLRNWSFYALQTMIEYKARKEGIIVRYIDPFQTSQTCCHCGDTHGERKGIDFICTNPQCEHYGQVEHADYNAARNISMSTRIIK